MITLRWYAEDSERDPAGGDVLNGQTQSITLDGSITEGYDSEATATEHPVENGADITDHVKAGLRRMTFEVVVSAHPALNIPDVSATASPLQRPAFARKTLEGLILSGQELEIESAAGVWESMLLLVMSETRSSEHGDGFRATLTAREFRRVSTEDVEAPSPRVERGRRTSDRGRQTGDGEDGTASATPADRASTLTRLVRLGEGYLDRRGAQ